MMPLLTADELSAWLAISRTAAYRFEPGRVRIGGSVRWDSQAVQRWLDRQREGEIGMRLKYIRV